MNRKDYARAGLQGMLDSAINERVEAARRKDASDAVREVRAQVLAACQEKASALQGPSPEVAYAR